MVFDLVLVALPFGGTDVGGKTFWWQNLLVALMLVALLFGGSGRDQGAAITGCCTPAAGRAVDREERELQDKEELEKKQEE